jgi:uncharacterized phage-like protein YoqJ
MTIAGTGHRPNKLGGYSEGAFRWLVLLLKKWLIEHPEVDEVISGMALGFDQALAQAAYELSIPFTAAVPFEGQEAVWKPSDKARYFDLLNKAKRVIYVGSPGYSNAKMHNRNHWMVDNCDEVLTMYDGTPGGTSSCLKYAESKGKKIHNIYELYKRAAI